VFGRTLPKKKTLEEKKNSTKKSPLFSRKKNQTHLQTQTKNKKKDLQRIKGHKHPHKFVESWSSIASSRCSFFFCFSWIGRVIDDMSN